MRKNKAIKAAFFKRGFYCFKVHEFHQRECNYITEEAQPNFGEQEECA